jgi:hypothetical protein
MISGLSFEYAYARVCACLAQRPDERLWLQLRSARSIAALLELVRGSAAAAAVSGIPVAADGDVVELAFRQQLRSRTDEVASWSPDDWRDALLYTRHLLDLPSMTHLLSDESPPSWWAADPVLAPYALQTLDERRAAVAAGPLAAIVQAPQQEPPPKSLRQVIASAVRRARSPPLHRALAVWNERWRSLWPPASADVTDALALVARTVEDHVRRFGTLAVDEAQPARQALAARLATLLRRFPAQPAALFAYLAVFALDLERLRGEFVRRARPVGEPA